MRYPKTRIEFDNLLVLLNRRIKVVLEQVRKRGIGADAGGKGIKLLRSFDLGHCFIKSQSGSEIKSKSLMRRRVVRVQVDGAFVFFFSFGPAPQLFIDFR